MALRLAKEQYVKSFARPLAVCTVLALSLGSVVVTASSASAADTDNIATIENLLATSQDVVLSEDVAGTGTNLELPAGSSSTIDLAGHDLTVQSSNGKAGIEVNRYSHLTIKDSVGGGTLTSTGSGASAGIGGGFNEPNNDEVPGLVEIQSGTVIATSGGDYGAGIGGEGWRSGPAVKISGGDVTAVAFTDGAGIGAGHNRTANSIEITGGTVNAYAGTGGAAIGGSLAGANSSTLISGGDVTLHGSDESVLGAAFVYGLPQYSFGTVAITGGQVTIPAGSFLSIPSTKTVVNSGTIVNDGSITGEGTLENNGVVIGAGDVTAAVTGSDYLVSFDARNGSLDTAPVPLRARSFFEAGRSLPIPTHQELQFSGWNTQANGTGTAIFNRTDLSTVLGSATSAAIPVTLYAMYGVDPIFEPQALPVATRGQQYSEQLLASGGAGLSFSILTGVLPVGLTLDPSTGTVKGRPTQAGRFELSIAAQNEGGTRVATVAIWVEREAKALSLVVPKSPVAVGSTVSIAVSGLDAGEEYSISAGDTVLASGTANSAGKASPKVAVIAGPDGARRLDVVGSNGDRVGTAALNAVAAKKKFSVSTNKKTYHYGQKATITVKKLAPGEKVSISFRGKTITSSKAVASSRGTYVISVSVGSMKGTKTIKVTGAKSTRAGSVSVKVVK